VNEIEAISPVRVGTALALNQDGNLLVVGGVGSLKTYDSSSSSWDLQTDLSSHFTTWVGAIDITSNGNFMVVGETDTTVPPFETNTASESNVKIFEQTEGTWSKVGSTFTSETPGDGFGFSVSISEDGERIAVGAPYGNYVDIIYPEFGLEFTKRYNEVSLGIDTNIFFGASVSIDSDAFTVAVGAPHATNNKGSAYIIDIRLDVIGQTFLGNAADDYYGSSVALSQDTSTLAIGSNGGSSTSSYVKLFRYDTSQQSYEETSVVTSTGHTTLSLSSNGERVAIGMPLSDSEGENSGKTIILSYQNDLFVAIGFISGSGSEVYSGSSVSLSGDGNRLAIGAIGDYNEQGSNSNYGSVRVWESQIVD